MDGGEQLAGQELARANDVRTLHSGPLRCDRPDGTTRAADRRQALEARRRSHAPARLPARCPHRDAPHGAGVVRLSRPRHASSTSARSLRVPPSQVYGVATFYSYFTLKPQGEHTCVVCTGTACYINGAPALLDGDRGALGVARETTSDGQVSVLIAHCVGACSIAPVVVIDGEVQGQAERRASRRRGDGPVSDTSTGRAARAPPAAAPAATA